MLKKLMPERIPAIGAVFYNLLPAKMFSPHYKMIAQELPLLENQTLLDIGTGPGMLPIEIARRFPRSRAIGIDLSEKMIEIASRHKTADNVSNVEFKVMDANALEFADNSLDFIISTGSLHHWKEPVNVLNEIYRCLKPDCLAWIYDGYGDATYADISKSIRKLFLGFPPFSMVKRILRIHGFTQNEYDTTIKEVVSKTNFKTCSFDKRGIMMRLSLRK